MIPNITIRVHGAQVRAAFEIAPKKMHEVGRAAIFEALGHLEGEVVRRTPVAHGILAGKVFSGLRGEEADGVIRGEVAVNPPADRYALPVETGTRPHFPPLDALVLWLQSPKMKAIVISLASEIAQRRAAAAAKRKIKKTRNYKRTPEEQAERALAFLIGRKISRQGTTGHFMFLGALRANQQQVVDHIARRIIGAVTEVFRQQYNVN